MKHQHERAYTVPDTPEYGCMPSPCVCWSIDVRLMNTKYAVWPECIERLSPNGCNYINVILDGCAMSFLAAAITHAICNPLGFFSVFVPPLNFHTHSSVYLHLAFFYTHTHSLTLSPVPSSVSCLAFCYYSSSSYGLFSVRCCCFFLFLFHLIHSFWYFILCALFNQLPLLTYTYGVPNNKCELKC